MRVLLLNQYYAPDEAATAQLLADVGAALAAAGHAVTALCGRRAYADPRRRYPAEERVQGVRVVRIPVTGFGRRSRLGRSVDYASFLAGAAVWLARFGRFDATLCLTTPPLMAATAALARRMHGGRLVLWSMDVYPDLAFALGHLREGSLAGRVLARVSRWSLDGSDHLIALGEVMERRLKAMTATPVSVVHNWADGEVIRPMDPASNAFRRRKGWEGRFVVMYSGNLGLAHDFETVLDAAERLKDDGDLRFVFLGGGPRRAHVEREVARRKLPNVEFHTYVPRSQLGESLTAADVHLITMKPEVEGLLVPSKIYGVLAAGRPAVFVGPSTCEVARIVREAGCGAVVPNGDGAGLARVLASLRRDDDARRRHGSLGRGAFEASFTPNRSIGRIREVLEGSTRRAFPVHTSALNSGPAFAPPEHGISPDLRPEARG